MAASAAMSTMPAVGIAGLALVAIGDWQRGWFRRGFRPLFEPPPGAWGWSAANLGKRVLQAGAVLTMALLLAADVPGVLRLSAAGASACTVVLVGRGLRSGVRALWVGLAVCMAIQLVLAVTLATETWQRLAVLVSAMGSSAGLLWLWGPLVQLDEGLPRFPDV